MEFTNDEVAKGLMYKEKFRQTTPDVFKQMKIVVMNRKQQKFKADREEVRTERNEKKEDERNNDKLAILQKKQELLQTKHKNCCKRATTV